MHELTYPFAAIVGQEQAKRALLLNIVNPHIGGVLLCGQKGTAKSTLVRGAAKLSGKKVVDLPLNTTEDMLIGSVDFEKTVKEGVLKFAGGILERANKNILYVDEINLLSDGMATALTAAAANEENLVEREGISWRHEASFVLVGTMNPEEGGLRPQLLDKFGCYVNIKGEEDLDSRIEIIRRRLKYEQDPISFCQEYEPQRQLLEKQIMSAITLMPRVTADENIRRVAGKLAANAHCQGNRAEILLIETASAVAALDNRKYVTISDLKEAAEFVLPHRQREAKDEPPPSSTEENFKHNQEEASDENQQSEGEQTENSSNEKNEDEANSNFDCPSESQQESKEEEKSQDKSEEQEQTQGKSDEQEISDKDNSSNMAKDEDVVEGEELYQIIRLPGEVRDRMARKGSGRRRRTNSNSGKGRYAGFTLSPEKNTKDLALDATLRAAAPFQKMREKNGCAVVIKNYDFRYKRREAHVGATIVFVVDASGSMGAAKRMKETKEAILSMLMDSYQKRDKIGLIAFRHKKAEILLGITSSVDLAQKKMQELPTGGRTPLADGLYSAWQLLHARKRKDPEMLPLIVLVTDGRANSGLWSEDPIEDAIKAAQLIANEKIPSIVVDTENDFLSFHLAEKIAEAMDADYYKVDELKSSQLAGIVSYNKETLLKESSYIL